MSGVELCPRGWIIWTAHDGQVSYRGAGCGKAVTWHRERELAARNPFFSHQEAEATRRRDAACHQRGVVSL